MIGCVFGYLTFNFTFNNEIWSLSGNILAYYLVIISWGAVQQALLWFIPPMFVDILVQEFILQCHNKEADCFNKINSCFMVYENLEIAFKNYFIAFYAITQIFSIAMTFLGFSILYPILFEKGANDFSSILSIVGLIVLIMR